MIAVKMGKYYKTYRVKIRSENTVANEKLKKVVNTFVERVITQRTPIRVAHRRADKFRSKKVANISIYSQKGQEIVLEIKGESGIYIKELIHGDSGRTSPNLSDELGTSCEVIELDVIKIHDDEEQ
jgi:tRNA pseudouridine synthase 10